MRRLAFVAALLLVPALVASSDWRADPSIYTERRYDRFTDTTSVCMGVLPALGPLLRGLPLMSHGEPTPIGYSILFECPGDTMYRPRWMYLFLDHKGEAEYADVGRMLILAGKKRFSLPLLKYQTETRENGQHEQLIFDLTVDQLQTIAHAESTDAEIGGTQVTLRLPRDEILKRFAAMVDSLPDEPGTTHFRRVK